MNLTFFGMDCQNLYHHYSESKIFINCYTQQAQMFAILSYDSYTGMFINVYA